MKFSILISSYNKADYLEKCLDSCLLQSNKNFEIILVDNFSSDNTSNILKKYTKDVVIIKKSKVSEYPSVNQIDLLKEAFKVSTGEIICLLDADDFFLENKIHMLNKFFADNENINIIFDTPKILFEEKFFQFNCKKKLSKYIWPTIYPTSCISLKRNFFSYLISKDFFNNYPLLEIDFRITVLSKMFDKKFKVIDDGQTIYRKVTDGIMSKRKKFSPLWWKKRFQAHLYLEKIFNFHDLEYKRRLDYYLSKLIYNLIKNFIK